MRLVGDHLATGIVVGAGLKVFALLGQHIRLLVDDLRCIRRRTKCTPELPPGYFRCPGSNRLSNTFATDGLTLPDQLPSRPFQVRYLSKTTDRAWLVG